MSTDIDGSFGVALGFVDGDTNLDAVFANQNERNRLWLGDGAGGFTCSDVSSGDGNLTTGVALASQVEDPPEQQLADPAADVNALDIPNGLKKSLGKKIDNAAKSFDNGDIDGACDKLGSFINHVNAQDGKKLTTQEAQDPRDAAQAIADAIGCDNGTP